MLFKREHEAAVVLQRSLLPQSLPELEGIELAARYEPAAPGLEVGGDWYEVVALDDGTVAMTIGDVAGRGIRAASIMGRVRPALRAVVAEGHPPDEAIEAPRRADQGVRAARRWRPCSTSTTTPRPRSPSTCAPAIRRRCCGSPTARRGPRRPRHRAARDPRQVEFRSARGRRPPGSLLLLYTDGLIERRGDDLLAGLARLRGVFSRAPAAADACLAQIADEYGTDQIPDDVAMLAFATGRPGSG